MMLPGRLASNRKDCTIAMTIFYYSIVYYNLLSYTIIFLYIKFYDVIEIHTIL